MMDIRDTIHEAFRRAAQESVMGGTNQGRNRQRSISWVETLASEFRKVYRRENDFRVFSKYHDQNKDFGMNELLYDISVCKTNYIVSPQRKRLSYIEKALWQVESEMAKDTRQLVYDFNKLVIGDAENKLFIGPLTSHDDEIMEILKKIAMHCRGNVWVVMIPHPGEWESKSISSHLEKMKILFLK